jgi:uncharacterized delta-60 repeat protein
MKPNRIDGWCRRVALAAVTASASLLAPQELRAAAGLLDPRFGQGGIVLTDFSGNGDYGFAAKVQPDGKVIVAGQSGVYPLFHSALARYNTDGSLDQAFGIGGKVIAALDPRGDGLSAVAIQPDGKIVAAGAVIHDNFTIAFLVARFNADGGLDEAFGENGSVITTFGDPTAQGNDVVLQADGKIVVVGTSGAGAYSELNDFAVVRYDSDGSLDDGFGNGGKLKTHFPGQFNTGSSANAALIQTDGRLVVAGTYKNERTPHEFALARYNADGSLDPTFGEGGRVTTRAGLGDAVGFAVALQREERIVLAGYSYSSQEQDFALACYRPDGTLETRFGSGGLVATDFAGEEDIAYALVVQEDGKLVVGGLTGEYPERDFGLARYNIRGQLDQGFGIGGKVTTNIAAGADQAYALALDARERILMAGISIANGSTFDFAVARYLSR